MNSVSNYYYQMSKGKFRLMADYYPQKIVIPDSLYFDSWAEINAYVLSQIPAAYNWSKYDTEKTIQSTNTTILFLSQTALLTI